MSTRFKDRRDAGRRLGALLGDYANRNDVLILALPRGGVPVGFEVARALNAPLDLFLVRKLGVPGQEELAMGAIASGGVRVLNPGVVQSIGITDEELDLATLEAQAELQRREDLYRQGRPLLPVVGQTVILVDDGLATGSTMRAAAAALKQMHPARLVVAVPVASPEVCDDFRTQVDEIICAKTPDNFLAVGMWYDDFSQTTDQEVRDLLEQSRHLPPTPPSTQPTGMVT
jgi:predicted phosphoribosyltransferase